MLHIPLKMPSIHLSYLPGKTSHLSDGGFKIFLHNLFWAFEIQDVFGCPIVTSLMLFYLLHQVFFSCEDTSMVKNFSILTMASFHFPVLPRRIGSGPPQNPTFLLYRPFKATFPMSAIIIVYKFTAAVYLNGMNG